MVQRVGFKPTLFLLMVLLTMVLAADTENPPLFWFKGQTHAHTVNSDGDDFPRRVVRWYRDHNYNFLVITDHDRLTDIKYLDTDKLDDFILIPGIEVSDSFDGKPLHINGINVKETVKMQKGQGIVHNLQRNIDMVRKAGGIAMVNHPNWKWAFGHRELSALNRVKLFELYNMDKHSNNFSAGGRAGMEEVWDKVLSRRVLMYGVITDDAHDYEGEFRPRKSLPGRGWIMVRAAELTPDAIVTALERGDFYGTVGLGITLKDIQISQDAYTLEIEQYSDFKYTTLFIGKNGRLLKEDYSLKPAYKIKGNEGYVRAKVICSSGDFAIAQPVMVKKNLRKNK
jgi:hypothetical protein